MLPTAGGKVNDLLKIMHYAGNLLFTCRIYNYFNRKMSLNFFQPYLNVWVQTRDICQSLGQSCFKDVKDKKYSRNDEHYNVSCSLSMLDKHDVYTVYTTHLFNGFSLALLFMHPQFYVACSRSTVCLRFGLREQSFSSMFS